MNENSLISQFGSTKLNSFKRRATELNSDNKRNGQNGDDDDEECKRDEDERKTHE